MTSEASRAQAGAEKRKMPAGRARRRSIVAAGLGLAALAAIWLVPALWTGLRTIDLRGLKRVRARRIAGRLGKITYLMVTDTAGVCIAFSAEQDIRTIRRALDAGMRQEDAQIVKVSRLARGVLGIRPLPGWILASWTLASIELTILVMLGCAFTVIALAGK